MKNPRRPLPDRWTLPGFALLLCSAASSFVPGPAAAQPATEAGSKVIRGVSYVGVTVSDVESSSTLYQHAASLKAVAGGRIGSSDALGAVTGRKDAITGSRLLASSNAQIRLMQFRESPAGADSLSDKSGAVPVNGPGMAHVCYQSDGDIATYQKFLAGGVEPLGNPEMVSLNPRNPVLYAYALDADGIMFEVEHVDVDAIQTTKPPKGFSRIRHISLASPDIERAVSFYSGLLQNPTPRRLGGEDGLSGDQFDQVSGLPGTRLKMAWFAVRNLELELVQYLSHPTELPTVPRPLDAPGYNMIVFDVTDLEAAKELLLSAGGSVVTEPQPMDDGQIFFGRDPDLNLLGFLLSPESSIVSSQRFPKQ